MFISLDKTGAIKCIAPIQPSVHRRRFSAGDDLRDLAVKGPANARSIWYISSISRSTCRDVRKSAGNSCYGRRLWPVDGTLGRCLAMSEVPEWTFANILVHCSSYKAMPVFRLMLLTPSLPFITDHVSDTGRAVRSVWVCVFLRIWTIAFEINDIWHRYFPRWIRSCSKVKVIG